MTGAELNAAGEQAITGAATYSVGSDALMAGKVSAAQLVVDAGTTGGQGSITGGIRTALSVTGMSAGSLGVGDISLTAGVTGGDITFANSLVSASDALTLTAASGGLFASGYGLKAGSATLSSRDSITGDADNRGAFLLEASTLVASVTGSGLIRVENRGDLTLDATTAQGDVSVTTLAAISGTGGSATTTSGNLVAQRVTAASGAASITLTAALPSPDATLTRDSALNALASVTLGQITGSSVVIDAGSQIDQLNSPASVVVADQFVVRANEAISLTGLNIGAVDAYIRRAGDLSLVTTGSATIDVQRLWTTDGQITLESSRSIALQAVARSGSIVTSGVVANRSGERTPKPAAGVQAVLTALPLDVEITSTGGSILGQNVGTHIQAVAESGGAISLDASTHIDLTFDAIELRDVDAGSTISLTQDVVNPSRNQLLVSDVRSASGDVTITAEYAMEVGITQASAVGASLSLKASAGDLTVLANTQPNSGRSIDAGSSVRLETSDNLTLHNSIWIDAADRVEFIAGRSFTVPTTQAFDAEILKVVSAENISVQSQLRVGDGTLVGQPTRVELRSGRDILVQAPISNQQGNAIDDIVLYSDGESARSIQLRSEVGGLRVIEGASGRLYFEQTLQTQAADGSYSPSGDYLTDRLVFTSGSVSTTYYIFDAIDYRANRSGQGLTVLSENIDGSGTLYALTGATRNGDLLTSLGSSITYSETQLAQEAIVQVMDRALISLTATAGLERASLTLDQLTSDGEVTLKLGASETIVSANVTTASLAALAAAINAVTGTTGISATGTGSSLVLSRTDDEAIRVTGYQHVPVANADTGTMRVLPSLGESVLLSAEDQIAVANALAPKMVSEQSSNVTLNQGQTAYNRIQIDALSPNGTTLGNINLNASQTIDLDAITLNASGTISVTTTSGAKAGQVMTLEDGSGRVFADQVLDSTQATSGVTWNLSSLANGTYSLRAVLRDADGNIAYSSGVTQLTVTGSIASATIPSALTPTISAIPIQSSATASISGSGARDWTRVRVYDAATNALLAETRADGSGNWSAVLPVLADGAHSIYAKNVDDSGNVGPSSATSGFTIDTQAPQTPVVTAYDPNTLTVSGTGENGSTVSVYVDGIDQGVTASVASGVWSAVLPTATVDGLRSFQATAADTLGNVSGLSALFAKQVGAVAGPTLTLTENNKATATATIDNTGVLTDITVVDSGANYISAPAVTIGAPPAGGTQATATAVLENGRVKSFTITNAGSGYVSAPTISIPAPFTVNATDKFAGYTVSGSVDAGSAVTVEIAGQTAQDAWVTGANWSYTFSDSDLTALGAAGVNGAFTVRAENAGGGVSTTSAAVNLKTSIPTVAVTPNMQLSQLSAAGSISMSVNGSAITATIASTDDLSALASAIDAVSGVSATHASGVVTVVSSTNTNIAITGFEKAGGTLSLQVAGSSIPVGTMLSEDGVDAAHAITASTTTNSLIVMDSLSGNMLTGVSDGSTIDILRPDGVALVQGISVANGQWMYSLEPTDVEALGNGDHTLKIRATDVAGNQRISTQIVRVAAIKPSAPSIDQLADDLGLADLVTQETSEAYWTLHGSSEPGSTLDLSYVWTPAAGSALSTVSLTQKSAIDGDDQFTVNALTGNWTARLSKIGGDGVFAVSMTATKGGVDSDTVTQNIVVDETAPAASVPSVDDATSGQPLFKGTTEVNSIVTIFDNDTPVATVTPDANGNWQWSPSEVWTGGSLHSITTQVSDLAGNLSSASAAASVTVAAGTEGLSFSPVTGDNRIDGADRSAGVTLSGMTESATLYAVVNGGTAAAISIGKSLDDSADIAVSDADQGAGYTVPPVVTISGGGGSGALATAILDVNGAVTHIRITNPGAGYTSAPNVSIAPVQSNVEACIRSQPDTAGGLK